jgi:hypothetical protein
MTECEYMTASQDITASEKTTECELMTASEEITESGWMHKHLVYLFIVLL